MNGIGGREGVIVSHTENILQRKQVTYRSDSAGELFLKCYPQHSGRTALDFFIADAKEKLLML